MIATKQDSVYSTTISLSHFLFLSVFRFCFCVYPLTNVIYFFSWDFLPDDGPSLKTSNLIASFRLWVELLLLFHKADNCVNISTPIGANCSFSGSWLSSFWQTPRLWTTNVGQGCCRSCEETSQNFNDQSESDHWAKKRWKIQGRTSHISLS